MNTVSLISTVRCLFQDSFKNVWAGMWGGGINFLSHKSPILMFIVILLSSIRVVA